ncbi:MAG: lysylphosphatidylglycerol synthase transmembrane domain-containing protein [Aquihabitans sp.]
MTTHDRGVTMPGPPRMSGRARLLTGAGLVLGAVAVGFVVKTLVDSWPDVSEEIRTAEAAWLVAAAALAALAMVSMAWNWRFVLRLLGVEASARRVVPWYFVGELGKYLPGGIWPVVGRGELARRNGVVRSRAYASVALSLAVLYLAAMFVAAAFLPFALSGGGFNPWMLCLIALPVGVWLLHHRVLERMVAFASRLAKRPINVEIPRWSDSLVLVARYVPTWLLVGTATWCVARSIDAGASYPRVMFASVLSWIVGFLAVPVPSGAGIRETVLYAASDLSKSVAVTTAVAARLLFVAVDLLGAGIGAPLVGRRRSARGVSPADASDKGDTSAV